VVFREHEIGDILTAQVNILTFEIRKNGRGLALGNLKFIGRWLGGFGIHEIRATKDGGCGRLL
jgi:hypothetical protein